MNVDCMLTRIGAAEMVMDWLQAASAMAQIVVSVALLWFQQRVRLEALRTGRESPYSVFLPVHWRLFAGGAVADMVMSVAFIVNVTVFKETALQRMLVSVVGRSIVLVTSAIIISFLVQQGAGTWSIHRAVWTGATMGMAHVTLEGALAFALGVNSPNLVYGMLGLHLLTASVFLFFGLNVYGKYVMRRPAVLFYARYWTVYYLLGDVGELLSLAHIDVAVYIVYGLILLVFQLKAVVAYKTLERDSRYWHGLDSTVTYKTYFGGLADRQLSIGSVDVLYSAVEGLRNCSCIHMLNYAYLDVSENMLGAGAQARVYRGTYKHRQVAVKVYVCLKLTDEVVKAFTDEVSALSDVASPYIVTVYGVCVVPPNICYVMELCTNGSLNHWLAAHPELTWADKMRVCFQCASALAALHMRNYVHQDLKAENFLVAGDGTVKMCDLGVARKMKQTCAKYNAAHAGHAHAMAPQTAESVQLPSAGSLPWCAPELLQNDAQASTHSDVYALCMVIWEVCTGQRPFETRAAIAASPIEIARFIVEFAPDPSTGESPYPPSPKDICAYGAYRGRPAIPTHVPLDLANIIVSGWVRNPSQRPSAAAIADKLQAMLRQ